MFSTSEPTAGKRAKLEVVDQDTGSWGNISLDHVVFSDLDLPPGDPGRKASRVAKLQGLDPAILTRFIAVLKSSQSPRIASNVRSTDVVFEDFTKPTFENWTTTGDAFGDGPTTSRSQRVGSSGLVPVLPGLAHSGLTSNRLQGTLRSRTFVITKRFLHVLGFGQKGQMRIIVDGFEKTRDPIYGGLVIDLNNPSAQWQSRDLAMWVGQKAYIEIADGAVVEYRGPNASYAPGDGYLAVDEIRFSNDRVAPGFQKPIEIQESDVSNSLEAWRLGNSEDRTQRALAAWLGDHELFPSPTLNSPLLAQFRELEKTLPSPTFALTICDGSGEEENILIRGSAKTPGELAPRRFLEAIAGSAQPSLPEGSGPLGTGEADSRSSLPPARPRDGESVVEASFRRRTRKNSRRLRV